MIISKLHGIIYDSLWHYWNDADEIGLISSLLDPRLKAMDTWSDEIKQQTISKLKTEFLTLVNNQSNSSSSQASLSSSSTPPEFIKKIFRKSKMPIQTTHNMEIENYLNLPIFPENTDVYMWWNSNKNTFPILFQLARKYLSIPATSVPCERLFSDAGNCITIKRSRLSPQIVTQLLFVKKNQLYCNVW